MSSGPAPVRQVNALDANRARYAQRLEARPWFEAGVPIESDALLPLLQQSAAQGRAYCVYVHVPFCRAICRFCALYTRAVAATAVATFDDFVEQIERAVSLHPQAGHGRSPSTVHFGGGTPLHVGAARLQRIVEAIRGAFGDARDCEWALESTTSDLEPAVVDSLQAVGFSRIHVGIQTLDDRVRADSGRRESGQRALQRVRMLVERGIDTSVDLIMGLPGCGAQHLLADLGRLHDAGVQMFSICELRHRRGVVHGPRDDPDHRQQWAAIWGFMVERGLAPIHIGQFARSQDDNRYYTHPAREEDCVALGPYAHGSAGPIQYANRLMPDYSTSLARGELPILAAVRHEGSAIDERALERELLAHTVRPTTLERLRGQLDGFPALVDAWRQWRLLEPSTDGAQRLTEEGSWYIGNMIEELRALHAATVRAA